MAESKRSETLEGRESVTAALKAFARRFEVILIKHNAQQDKLAELLALAEARQVAVRWVDPAELEALTHGVTHGGVVAIVSPKGRMTEAELGAMLEALREPALLLLLEGVEDARNLGFTLRTAEAMGVHAVIIKKHLWDLDPVEIARPASGAYERMPLVQCDGMGLLEGLRRRGLKIYGCLANAKRSMSDVDLTEPAVLAIGGEKRGLSGAVRGLCTRFIHIPTMGGASSLSLSHAGAIVLAEALRQRRGGREAMRGEPGGDLGEGAGPGEGPGDAVSPAEATP